jgi:hypothetical protein
MMSGRFLRPEAWDSRHSAEPSDCGALRFLTSGLCYQRHSLCYTEIRNPIQAIQETTIPTNNHSKRLHPSKPQSLGSAE